MTYLKNLATAARSAGVEVMSALLSPLRQRPEGEQGHRLPSDLALRRLYSQFAISTELRHKILTIRDMEAKDGRVKNIHGRVARDMVRGGLVAQFPETASSQTLKREWDAFHTRLELNRVAKLRSDARGLVAEGNLPLQIVLDSDLTVAAAIRMPAETIVPMVDTTGRFKDPRAAYEQRDIMTGSTIATFAAWQLQLARFDPLSYDDMGEMGRPFLDATLSTWRKLVMTEEDLVVRRRQRAPLRLSHVLEGADEPALETYRKTVEGEKGLVTTDFYSTRKGGVTAIQGDANLDQIEDVVHLLDTFFAGTPLPKALMGYTGNVARDVLEDLKRDYYDEIDHLQDTLAVEYELVFRIHLLLKGIVPGPHEFKLRYSERRTETPNQVADLALKLMALGFPPPVVWGEMGYDPAEVLAAVEQWRERDDPYPTLNRPPMPPEEGEGAAAGQPAGAKGAPGSTAAVKVTPSNARKGESASYTPVPGTNHGRGRG
jgi:hypothetical protein